MAKPSNELLKILAANCTAKDKVELQALTIITKITRKEKPTVSNVPKQLPRAI